MPFSPPGRVASYFLIQPYSCSRRMPFAGLSRLALWIGGAMCQSFSGRKSVRFCFAAQRGSALEAPDTCPKVPLWFGSSLKSAFVREIEQSCSRSGRRAYVEKRFPVPSFVELRSEVASSLPRPYHLKFQS